MAGFDTGVASDAFGAIFPPTIEGDWKSGFLDIFEDPRVLEFGADIAVADYFGGLSRGSHRQRDGALDPHRLRRDLAARSRPRSRLSDLQRGRRRPMRASLGQGSPFIELHAERDLLADAIGEYGLCPLGRCGHAYRPGQAGLPLFD